VLRARRRFNPVVRLGATCGPRRHELNQVTPERAGVLRNGGGKAPLAYRASSREGLLVGHRGEIVALLTPARAATASMLTRRAVPKHRPGRRSRIRLVAFALRGRPRGGAREVGRPGRRPCCPGSVIALTSSTELTVSHDRRSRATLARTLPAENLRPRIGLRLGTKLAPAATRRWGCGEDRPPFRIAKSYPNECRFPPAPPDLRLGADAARQLDLVQADFMAAVHCTRPSRVPPAGRASPRVLPG